MSQRTVSPETILEPFSPEIVALVAELRRMVKETDGRFEETGDPGWRAVVRFLFEQGVHLTDPAGMLSGNTKQTRYIDLTPGQALPVDALRTVILEAISFGEARKATRKTSNLS